MSEHHQDMRKMQTEYRKINQNRAVQSDPSLPGRLVGKEITRFPVYLTNGKEKRVANTVKEVNAIVARGGTWESAGVAPRDIAKAHFKVDADVSSANLFTKRFGFFRILSIENGTTIHLFPKGKIETSHSWLDRYRPHVGGYVIRQGHLDVRANLDGYSAINEKIFQLVYGDYMDPAFLEAFTEGYQQAVKAMHAPVSTEQAASVAAEITTHDANPISDKAEALDDVLGNRLVDPASLPEN